MPEWLKILLMITSTIIGIVFVVVVLYHKKTSNGKLSEKHLNKKEKSKSLGQYPHIEDIELKEMNCSQKLTALRPMSHTSTNNSLKSMATDRVTQLLNPYQNLPDSPLLQYYWAQGNEKYKWPADSSNIRFTSTPDSVKSFLEDTGLDFSKYHKYQCKTKWESK